LDNAVGIGVGVGVFAEEETAPSSWPSIFFCQGGELNRGRAGLFLLLKTSFEGVLKRAFALFVEGGRAVA
jgi:hypothetical protein